MFGDRPGPSRDLRELAKAVRIQHDEVLKRLTAIDRRLRKMPTRDEFNQAKDALRQAIADAAQRVADDIQALRDELAAGNPITDQDLSDLKDDALALGDVDKHEPPAP